MRGTLAYVCADNLGAHGLGGFVESFTAEHFCRYCLVTRTAMQETQVAQFELRNKTSYEAHCEIAQSSDKINNHMGIKNNCCLHKFLTHFHVTLGLPPDVAHDLLEGIVPYEIAICLQALIDKGYFTLDGLNGKIKTFPYTFSDKVNAPHPISATYRQKQTIGGNASENWALIRLLPLIIGHLIPETENVWQLLMDLKDIVELSFSLHYDENLITYLESKIVDHRHLFQELFPDFRLKPKHHFIEHYPQLIRHYGPLALCWTLRFEGKHSFFKKIVHDTGNFKNILLTLATRHQLNQAYYLSLPSFFKPEVQTSTVHNISVALLRQELKSALSALGNFESVDILSTCTLKGTLYRKDMYVPYRTRGGLPEFAKIMEICMLQGNVHFIILPKCSYFLEHLHSFILTEERIPQVITPDQLLDYYPLSGYSTGNGVVIVPKHHIYISGNQSLKMYTMHDDY